MSAGAGSLRRAATVILVRAAGAGLEVFLLKRHRKATFMSSSFVFPGGAMDPGESPEVAAVRELFEEAGVLLSDRPLARDAHDAWRRRLNAGEAAFPAFLAEEKLGLDLGRLHRWSRWVTPAFEPKRFDAEFFLAELPPGQVPSFDDRETVEELWIGPAEAIERQLQGTLRLPPPQIRTLHELAAAGSIEGAVAASARRVASPATICPRRLAGAPDLTLLFPWDPEYIQGEGEGDAVPPGHLLATPPTRVRWNGTSWV